MTDRDDADEGELSPQEIERLRTWDAPTPPTGFGARVVNLARAQTAEAPAPRRASAPPMSRFERDRRRRRRSALAALLGAAAVSGGGGFVALQAGASAAPAAVGVMAIYVAALAFGGILLIASLVGSHDHADHHLGGHDHDQGHDHDHADAAPHAALVLPFLSLRFWIFGLTFFGLTGVVLHGFGLASPLATSLIASSLGLAMGYGAAQLFQALARQTVGEVAADGGHVGREGKLLLPVARGQRGKVRVMANGVATDLLVETDEDAPLPAGTTVLIVAMRGTVAVVERSPTPNPSAE